MIASFDIFYTKTLLLLSCYWKNEAEYIIYTFKRVQVLFFVFKEISKRFKRKKKKRTTSLQATTSLSPMCPFFGGFTVYTYMQSQPHIFLSPCHMLMKSWRRWMNDVGNCWPLCTVVEEALCPRPKHDWRMWTCQMSQCKPADYSGLDAHAKSSIMYD